MTATPVRVTGATDVPVTASVTVHATLDIVLDDAASPEDQLKMARKEIQDLRQRLAQAEARLAMYKAREEGGPQTLTPNTTSAAKQNKNGQPNVYLRTDAVRAEADLGAGTDRDVLVKSGVHNGTYRVITDPATGRIREIIERPLTPPATTAQQADRLDKLEAQLRDLLHELQAIRQQSTQPETHDFPARK